MITKFVPMLQVPDVRSTVEWYVSIGFDVLDTYVEDDGEMNRAELSLGSSQLMLNAGGRPSAHARRDVDLYIETDDVEESYGALADRVEIVEELHDTFYGMREFVVRDCNGFWLTFAQQLAP